MGIAERKAREKHIRNRQILRASYRIFNEVGFAAATMEQIAERAELAKGTIYLYFKSKEELYFSLLVDGLDILIRLLEETDKRGPLPAPSLMETGRTLLRFYREHTGYFRIFTLMQQEDMQARLSGELSEQINSRATTILNLLSRQVRKTPAAAAVPQAEAWQVANLLWGSFNGIAQLALIRERFKARPFRVDELIDLGFDLIERGLAARPPEPAAPARKAKPRSAARRT